MKAMADGLPWLTDQHRRVLQGLFDELQQAAGWTGNLPVLLLDRCWLRLQTVPISELAWRLPPEASCEAPELVRYRDLLQRGVSPWDAQLQCWEEFGASSCQQALQRFWACREGPDHGWTLQRYGDLVRQYRDSLEASSNRRLPLLVLARPGSRERHRLHWLEAAGLAMRHTCA